MADQPTDRTAAEASVPKRGRGRPKGSKASEKQKATAPAARKASAAARKKRKQAREAELEPPRWKQVEDGTLAIKDLTDEELIRGEVSNNDGSWEGRRHQLAPRLQQQMNTEWKRRFRNKFDQMGKLALEAIEDILQDVDSPAQRFAAAKMVTEYQIGKVPEVVHIGVETEYDKLSQQAFVVLRGAENVTVDETPELSGAGVVVEGQVVEEKEHDDTNAG